MKKAILAFIFCFSSIAGAKVIYTYQTESWWWGEQTTNFDLLFTPKEKELFQINKSEASVPKKTKDVIDYYQEQNLLLTLPFKSEVYIAAGNSGHHHHENGYGDFAWDFVKLGPGLMSYKNGGKVNEDFYVWNEPVYAPVSGTVVELVRSEKDNPANIDYSEDHVPEFSQSNLIGIEISKNLFVYLLHFKKDSIPDTLKIGSKIEAGDFLGTVGNSGVSYVPHLHVTYLWWNGNRMWSVPGGFKNIEAKNLSDRNFSNLGQVPLANQIVRKLPDDHGD